MITTLTRSGATGFSIGLAFSVAAVGGLLGALSAPALQRRLPPPVVVIGMGWVAAGCLAGLAWLDRPLVMGAILGLVYFVAAPANALLLATQITRTPAHLQGRVIAAALLIAGLAAPLGAPAAGVLMDRIGPTGTFVSASLVVAVITVIMHLTRSIRTMTR
jgi:predicted MFS family arabinose efflux permease